MEEETEILLSCLHPPPSPPEKGFWIGKVIFFSYTFIIIVNLNFDLMSYDEEKNISEHSVIYMADLTFKVCPGFTVPIAIRTYKSHLIHWTLWG